MESFNILTKCKTLKIVETLALLGAQGYGVSNYGLLACVRISVPVILVTHTGNAVI